MCCVGTGPRPRTVKRILAVKAHQRLAKKDLRILKRMELAAQNKMESGAFTDREFWEARNKQEMTSA